MRLLATVPALALLMVPLGQTTAAQQRERVDVAKLGPQVGQQVPAFSLKDQTGKIQTLQSIMGPKGAMLVFLRSADWWPYCRTQLVELQSQFKQLRDKGLGLATISYDSTEILKTFSDQHGITFPMLSDVGSPTIKAYGILATVGEEALDKGLDDPVLAADVRVHVTVLAVNERVRGIPYPGSFIVDRQGRVTSRFFEDFFRERNTVSNLMLKLGQGGPSVQGTQASTNHLEIKTYPTDATVALGNRFSLVLEITPHKGMHVYAPGATGYRVIALTVAPQPFVKVLPMQYPPSEIYFFRPLNERVPVYQKPFTLLQEVVPEVTQEAEAAARGKDTLALTGTFEYQACDDKVCYNPASVPLSWTLAIKPFERPAPRTPAPRQP